ncbi:hypothetical protein GCM10010452_69180 [Crossiella cryophila]
MSNARLVVCGLPSEMVVVGLQQSPLSCYLEPVAENIDQLRLMTDGADPLIRGGRPLVFVITDTAGPLADVATWIELMSAQPAEEVAVVLVDTGSADKRASPAHQERVLVHTWGQPDTEPAGLFESVGTALAHLQPDSHPAPKRVTEPHVLVVATTRGGAGGSTVALSLAAYLGAQTTRSKRVCLLDLDLSTPALASMTGATPNTTQPLLLERHITLGVINRHVTPLPAWRIDLLPGCTTPLESRFVPPAAVAATVDLLAGHYDLVVIDAGRLRWDLDGPEHTMIESASQVLIVADPARNTVNGLEHLSTTLCGPTGHDFPARHTGLVWNRVRASPTPVEFIDQHGSDLVELAHLPDISDNSAHAATTGQGGQRPLDNPAWAARIHLLLEAVAGPGCVTPATPDVADLLPTLHRDGTPRTEIRVRRKFLSRFVLTAQTAGRKT